MTNEQECQGQDASIEDASPELTEVPFEDEQLGRLEAVVREGFEELLASFRAKLAYDASKQLQIDRLHDELQKHREDLVSRAARPLVIGVIRLHGDMGRLVSAVREMSQEELSPDRFFSLMEGLREDVEILLEQNGITSFRCSGDRYDPSKQRAVFRVTTDQESLDCRVAESLDPGFMHGAAVLEKEKVSVYEYKPCIASEGDSGHEFGVEERKDSNE